MLLLNISTKRNALTSGSYLPAGYPFGIDDFAFLLCLAFTAARKRKRKAHLQKSRKDDEQDFGRKPGQPIGCTARENLQ